MINLRQVHRLFTHEDAKFLHAHKIFGLSVLIHFAYRLYLQVTTGSMHFNNTYTPYWIAIHFLLHVTSFQFKIPTRRNLAYNIIWPEMLFHSMIFASRSLFAMLIQWLVLNNYLSQYISTICRGPLVICTMILADISTKHAPKLSKSDSTDTTTGQTMRLNPYPLYVSPNVAKYINLFYSQSQIIATMAILFYNDIGKYFLHLLAIQVSPLLMTLEKKGIINRTGWHVFYTLTLLINYIYGIYCDFTKCQSEPVVANHLALYCLIVLLTIGARFGLNMNKYVLWSAVIVMQLRMLL
jgi:hypothetical protein